MNKNEEQYKIFKQIVHTFYHSSNEKEKQVQSKVNNLIIKFTNVFIMKFSLYKFIQ